MYCADSNSVNTGTIIIVWQKANGELWTHTYFKSGNKNTWKWTDPVKLGNDIPAVNNTPIAAAAWLAGGKFVCNGFSMERYTC
jgi:hypothetical protein